MLKAFAGRCLALVGPLAPNNIAFNAEFHIMEPQLTSEGGPRIGIAAETSLVVQQVLQQLAFHIIDDDSVIVADAQSTLRQVSLQITSWPCIPFVLPKLTCLRRVIWPTCKSDSFKPCTSQVYCSKFFMWMRVSQSPVWCSSWRQDRVWKLSSCWSSPSHYIWMLTSKAQNCQTLALRKICSCMIGTCKTTRPCGGLTIGSHVHGSASWHLPCWFEPRQATSEFVIRWYARDTSSVSMMLPLKIDCSEYFALGLRPLAEVHSITALPSDLSSMRQSKLPFGDTAVQVKHLHAFLQVKLKPELAELLLPQILLDLAVYDNNSELCSIISEQVRIHIFTKPYPDVRVVTLFLKCCNQLRTFQLESSETKRRSKDDSSELLTDFLKSGEGAWEKVSTQQLHFSAAWTHWRKAE